MAKKKMKKLNRNHKIPMTVGGLDDIRKAATLEAVKLTNYFPLLILRDKVGLGEVTLKRFQKSYLNMWDKYNKGELNIDHASKEVKKATGIEFGENKDNTHLYPDKPKNHKIMLKKRELDRIRKNALNDAFKIVSYFPLYILRTEYGYGKVRLIRFYNHYLDLFDSYNKGYLTLDDIAKVLKDEVNITWVEEE